jgi:hypothetical protein
MSSTQSSADTWFSHRDATYDASVVALTKDSGVYLSFSTAAQGKVIDKVGWGTPPANGFEGTKITALGTNASVQRKPAGGQGATTDTDVNSTDFNAPSTSLTPKGTADALEP